MDTTLRTVELQLGYALTTWDALKRNRMGKYMIGYRLDNANFETVFEGEDMAVGINTAIDSDEALRAVLSFLTLCEGDVEDDYFAEYTPIQLAFRDSDAEWLAMHVHPEMGYTFEDID